MSRALDRRCQTALVLGAGAGPATGEDLAAIRQVALQSLDVLVISDADLVRAELQTLRRGE
jgi:hypothetical protein